MSTVYVRKLGKPLETLNLRYCVTILSGEVLCSCQVLRACLIQIAGRDLYVDLIVLDIQDCDVILGMD